ncbi:MAG: hypothetical protein U0802_05865 [Candidatus Binatia bacterium]
MASGLTEPTAVALSPDGRIFVAEKSGSSSRSWTLPGPRRRSSPTCAPERTTTGSAHGGLVLHPDFSAHAPHLHVTSTRSDARAIGGTPPAWGTVGGIARQLSDAARTDQQRLRWAVDFPPAGEARRRPAAGAEQVLIELVVSAVPSHRSIMVIFGNDGALYAQRR